jgi:hypothetical protein
MNSSLKCGVIGDVNGTRREFDDEENVIADVTAGCPDFFREEIGRGEPLLVRFQESIPRRGLPP